MCTLLSIKLWEQEHVDIWNLPCHCHILSACNPSTWSLPEICRKLTNVTVLATISTDCCATDLSETANWEFATSALKTGENSQTFPTFKNMFSLSQKKRTSFWICAKPTENSFHYKLLYISTIMKCNTVCTFLHECSYNWKITCDTYQIKEQWLQWQLFQEKKTNQR